MSYCIHGGAGGENDSVKILRMLELGQCHLMSPETGTKVTFIIILLFSVPAPRVRRRCPVFCPTSVSMIRPVRLLTNTVRDPGLRFASHPAWRLRVGLTLASCTPTLFAGHEVRLAAVGVMGWAVLRFGRTPVAFAGVISLMFLVFLGFNKQAFCNYYFLVIGGLCCAVAASEPKKFSAREVLMCGCF